MLFTCMTIAMIKRDDTEYTLHSGYITQTTETRKRIRKYNHLDLDILYIVLPYSIPCL